ncbi:MAG: adenylate/guanylate cyclase domain-containing protein, partial [Planctomycetota bacterium]
WLDVVVPGSSLFLTYLAITLEQYLRVGRSRRKLRKTFDNVLQPKLVNALLEDRSGDTRNGRLLELTVLFSDLQNSTALSEKIPPEVWVQRLNEYFDECTRLLLDHDAYLDKYIGDGVMAIWGAPVGVEGPAAKACLAVVEMRQRLDVLQAKIREEYDVELVTRIGLNTGQMVVGMVGGEKVSHYTVLGDAVVVASRLEGANKFFGTKTLIGPTTYEQAAGAIEAREVDRVVLKGKTQWIAIYEPLSAKGELSDSQRELRDTYAEALEHYRARRWDESLAALTRVLERNPNDGPSRVLRDRIAELKKNPPPDGWEGEFLMTSK